MGVVEWMRVCLDCEVLEPECTLYTERDDSDAVPMKTEDEVERLGKEFSDVDELKHPHPWVVAMVERVYDSLVYLTCDCSVGICEESYIVHADVQCDVGHLEGEKVLHTEESTTYRYFDVLEGLAQTLLEEPKSLHLFALSTLKDEHKNILIRAMRGEFDVT